MTEAEEAQRQQAEARQRAARVAEQEAALEEEKRVHMARCKLAARELNVSDWYDTIQAWCAPVTKARPAREVVFMPRVPAV